MIHSFTGVSPVRLTGTPWPPRVRSSYRRQPLVEHAHTVPRCTPLRCSTKHNAMEMFDGTSLLAVWFCSASNAAHAALTGLFCIRRLYRMAADSRSWPLSGCRLHARRLLETVARFKGALSEALGNRFRLAPALTRPSTPDQSYWIIGSNSRPLGFCEGFAPG